MCQRNSRARRHRTLTMLAAVAPVLSGHLFAQTFQVNQDNYYYNGSLTVPDSRYAEFGLTYTPGASVQFFNAVDLDTGQWIVQNQPMLTTHEVGTGSYSSSEQFDLGVADGTAVSAVNVHYTMNSSPLTSMPAPGGGGTLNLGLGTLTGITNSGVPSGSLTLNASGSPAAPAPAINDMLTWHRNMYNVVQEKNFCGPGAAANSINWLRDQNHFQIGQTPTDCESELAVDMGNNHDGNWDDAELSGKLEYILNHNIPVEVHYTGGAMAPHGAGSRNYSTPFGNARNDGAITWDWLEKEMAKGQDIELMTATHWVVVEGTYSNGSVKRISYRDDPYQEGASSTHLPELANRHVWTYFNNGRINIGNGDEQLLAAVAESPIKTLTALNFDPGNTSNNGIDPGTGVWDYSTNNFRGSGPGSTNTTWDDHCVAFGGGTNVCTISTGGSGVACDDLIVYGTCTINSATAGDVCRMQNEAHIECVSGGQFNCNAVIAGANGLLIDGDTASTQCNINSACTVSGKMTLNACQTTLGNNGTCQGITEIDCNRGAMLVCSDFAVNNSDRINDTCAMELNGGTWLCSASTSAHSSETCGPLVVGPGVSSLNPFGGSTGFAVTCASLSHTTDGGILHIGGSGVPINQTTVKFNTAPTLFDNMLPYVVVTTNNFTYPATYNQANGIIVVGFTAAEQGNINSLGITNNAIPSSSANATLIQNVSVNSLTIPPSVNVNAGTNNLAIASGLLLHQGSFSGNNSIITGTGALTNPNGGFLTIFVDNNNTTVPNTVTLGEPVADGAGGPVTLNIMGYGNVVAAAPMFHSGGTKIGGGEYDINNDNQLGTPGTNVTLQGSAGISPFDGTLGVNANVNSSGRNIIAEGGAIRVADSFSYTIGVVVSDSLGHSSTPRSIVLTSTNTASLSSPDLNGKIVLTGISDLNPDFTVVLKDVNLELNDPGALGNATLKIAAGNRAGTNNNIVKIDVDGGVATLDNETYQQALGYYQCHPGLGTINLAGYFRRENYNSTVGQVASANHTTLNLNAHALSYPGAIGLAAASGNINVFTPNAWDGYIGNRNVDVEGTAAGATTEQDASAGTINWYALNIPDTTEYYYSQLFSAARTLNGGTSYPLTLNVQQNVTVNFLGNGNSGVVCVLEDDAHKIGDGVMRFWYTGNGITAPPTTANSGNFYVDQGTLNWTVTANSAGQFPQDFNGGATGVSHSLLDGGISGNGVANYFFANGTTLIADFAHNPADGVNPSPRYVHFNFGINNGGDANSNMTINVTNQPLVLTSAPTNPVDPVPTTNWVGTLKKIGIGTLMLDTSRIASISAGAKLDLLDGDVMLYGGSGHDPFTSGANSVGVTVADSATLDDSTNTPLTVQYVYGHGFLVVRQNASLKLAPNNPLPNAAAALSIAGTTGAWTGKLDLTNNSLLLDNTGSVSFLQLVDQIRQGYHNGDWTPVGGIFSSLAGGVASDTENPFKTGVGILGGLMVQAAPLGAPLGAPPPGTILIRYTYYGDANCDGTVNTLDFNSLAQNFNSTSQIWSGGDFNYDGVVNALDFNALATNFGQVLASPPLGSVVPEPSLAAAILSGLLMLRRIRRE